MANVSPSLQNLIEELGFPSSEYPFLVRLFGSSDPFAGLPGTDLEPSHNRNQPGQLSSTSIAGRLASTRLWQAIPPLHGEGVNQSLLPPTHRRPGGFREGLEGRDLVHYEEEWTSLITADSESLFSELLQQLVLDGEQSRLESSELPEHPKASDNVANPGPVGPPSPSVYDSETGEPPDSIVDLNETRGTEGDCKTSQDLRASKETGSFEKLLQSFPIPPGRNQTVADRSCSQVLSDSPSDPQRVLPEDCAQANTSTVARSQIESVTSLPRISRFSEELADNYPIGEQDTSDISVKANTSALDTSNVVNTRNVSFGILSLPPSTSSRERSPTGHHEGQEAKLDSPCQAQDRANKYIAFPEYPPRVRPISYVIRRQRSLKPISEGRPASKATPRYYQKTPLRISSRPSTTSFASGKRSTQKCKRVLRRFVENLKRLFC
ncbi:uncharacterized protein N7500_005894 [Penicillium coprophilum]|uniref:uncharacterized protein n=1 Tax=Penicillium coprophilum TaxID=36646 RepID=UPI002385630E|nr:uncharacterized protein N7500_005894 [Penicillium coprophilum]KAJ5164064.1 hypothetical protein N7500_005894 [Penicillium coprophilum]